MVSGHLKNQLPRGVDRTSTMTCSVVPLTTGNRKPEREAAGKVIASHNSGRGTDSAWGWTEYWVPGHWPL